MWQGYLNYRSIKPDPPIPTNCLFLKISGLRETVADPDAAPFYVHMGAEPAGEAESGSIPGRLLPRLVHKL